MGEVVFFDLFEYSLGSKESKEPAGAIGIHADNSSQLGDVDRALTGDIFKEFELDGGLVGRELIVSGEESAKEGLGPVD